MYVFNSWAQTLTVVLRPSRKLVVGAEIIREPGLSARFERGVFTTDDPEVAELLRKKIAKDLKVTEITSEDLRVFEVPKAAPNVRTAVSAQDLSKVTHEKPVVKEKTEASPLECPVCQKAFTSKQNLNIHLVSHRQAVKDVGEQKPAVQEKAPSE